MEEAHFKVSAVSLAAARLAKVGVVKLTEPSVIPCCEESYRLCSVSGILKLRIYVLHSEVSDARH